MSRPACKWWTRKSCHQIDTRNIHMIMNFSFLCFSLPQVELMQKSPRNWSSRCCRLQRTIRPPRLACFCLLAGPYLRDSRRCESPCPSHLRPRRTARRSPSRARTRMWCRSRRGRRGSERARTKRRTTRRRMLIDHPSQQQHRQTRLQRQQQQHRPSVHRSRAPQRLRRRPLPPRPRWLPTGSFARSTSVPSALRIWRA